MYVSPNVKTKKELKERVTRGESVYVFSPGPFPCPQNGHAEGLNGHARQIGPHNRRHGLPKLDGRTRKAMLPRKTRRS